MAIPDEVLKEFEQELESYIEDYQQELETYLKEKEPEPVEKANSGVMVAWLVPEDLKEGIASEEDLPHVTLLYFGKLETLDRDTLDAYARRLKAVLSSKAPLQGEIAGAGRFPASPSSDGKEVAVRLVDIPRLEALREILIHEARAVGLEPKLNHGYTPHITLKYLDEGEEFDFGDISSVHADVTVLHLCLGPDRIAVPLMGEEVIKKETDAPNYRKTDSDDTCSNCLHGGDGYCDQFKFNYKSGHVCDVWYGMEPRLESYIPPVEVQENARAGMKLWGDIPEEERKVPDEVVSLGRAMATANPVHIDRIAFITDYFASHADDPNSEDWRDRGASYQSWFLLGSRAGRSWAQRVQRKHVEKVADVVLSSEISKLDESKRLVFGWITVAEKAGKPLVDRQGDVISPEEMEEMAYNFMLSSRKAGEMHSKVGVGKMVESIVLTEDKQKALGIDLGKVGWWGGFKVSDEATWERVKKGELRSFSIHGKALRDVITEKELESVKKEG